MPKSRGRRKPKAGPIAKLQPVAINLLRTETEIITQFNQPIVWFGLTPENARKFAADMLKMAEEVEEAQKSG